MAEFKSEEDLFSWLKNERKVSDVHANSSKMLFAEGYTSSDTLIGATFEQLVADGLSNPVARALSNKLMKSEGM